MNVPHTPPPKRRWLQMVTVDITPLRRHRDFRLLFIGQLVSFFGTMITSVAVPYQVYQLTHSVLVVGVLGLAELAALVAFAFLGGALADARDRRLLVLLTEVGLMVGSAILAANALLHQPLVWVLFVIASLSGAIDALQRPALSALSPRLVDRDEIPAAAALNSMRSTLGMVAGPAGAGGPNAAGGRSGAPPGGVRAFLSRVWRPAGLCGGRPPPPAARPRVCGLL